MTQPKPGPSLNIISVKLSKFPTHMVPEIGNALGKAGAVTVGDDTYLVGGDFMEWFLFLTKAGGEDIVSFKMYSLSAHHAGMDGLQPLVRTLCQRHLSNEIRQLGIDVPVALRDLSK